MQKPAIVLFCLLLVGVVIAILTSTAATTEARHQTGSVNLCS